MMSIQQKIKEIQERLNHLKSVDTKRKVFGATDHSYSFHPKLKAKTARSFEKNHSIVLPEEYRVFLETFGNGGAGPYYGLETLEDGIYDDLDFKRDSTVLDPSQPFLLTQAWNATLQRTPHMSEQDYEAAYESFAKDYSSPTRANGLLRISNYGCGTSLNIVVNGAEYGNIWADDRGNDGGILPDPFLGKTRRVGFLDWYLLWIDESLEECKKYY